MLKQLYLYWRWVRIKRVKVNRYIQLDFPRFGPISEEAAGDNFPVLTRTSVGIE